MYAVPPLNPDVTIVHAQRADADGNTQVWGLLGCQKEAAFAADRVIVVVEELVDEAVIRADPESTIIPGSSWTPWSSTRSAPADPSAMSRAPTTATTASTSTGTRSAGTQGALQAWLREWVYDLDGRVAYVEKRFHRLATLKPGSAPSGS